MRCLRSCIEVYADFVGRKGILIVKIFVFGVLMKNLSKRSDDNEID